MRPIVRVVSLAFLAAVPLVGAGCATRRPASAEVQRERDFREAAEVAAQAERAQRAGRWEEAVDLNRKALQRNGSMGGVWLNLGVGLMQLQENLEAAQCFQRAAELSATDPKPYENLALLHMNLGWHDDALRLYEMSLARSEYWQPSLRGAVLAAKTLNRSTEDGLERIKRALLVEKDPTWRRILDSEQVRVSQDIADQRKRDGRAN